MRRPVIGVMGSGQEAHAARAEPLGRWLAGRGCHLLTGGGGGVMASVARAFAETPGRLGQVIGVLPATDTHPYAPPAGYPNPWIDIAIRTHLPLRGAGDDARSRNHINVLSADAVIALAGGAGTLSEVRLALAYARPLIAHIAHADELPGLPAQVSVAPDLATVQAFVEGVVFRSC